MILQGEGRGEEARCDESANICKYAGKKGENFATSKHVKLIDEFITLIFDIIFLFKSEILALVLYFKVYYHLKVLTHEFLVGVLARLAPACSPFSQGLAFSALPSAPSSFSGDG